MANPVTLTVGAIAALTFTKCLESSAGEAAKKLTPFVLEKIETLRQKLWVKLRGIPAVDELNAIVEKGEKVTEQQIKLLIPYLESAMKEDAAFAQEVQHLTSEITQKINIGDILGENIQNVYGGLAIQIHDPNAPVFTGNISGSTFNCTYNMRTNPTVSSKAPNAIDRNTGKLESYIAQRFALFQKLSDLPGAQLDQILFTLEVPHGIVPSQQSPPGERIKAFLDWAKGPSGCGLNQVKEILFLFIEDP